MNPNNSGWFEQFCREIDAGKWQSAEFPGTTGYEPTLYRVIQPSGLMYGHPVRGIGTHSFRWEHLDPVARMKLIYAESLLTTGGLRLKTSNLLPGDPYTTQLVPEISDYFLNLYPDLYQGSVSSYLKDPYYLTEKLINARVSVKTSLVKNYLVNLFHNSLLFIDVYYFGEWVGRLGSATSSQINHEKTRLRLAILGIMALAAKADKTLQKEERALFEFYLESAGLGLEMKKQARDLLSNLNQPEELEIPEIDSWLIRKYMLEMAMLVVQADKKVSKSETEFIAHVGAKLKFSPDEISESMLAVESFVLSNWQAMHYLLGKHNLERISQRFVARLKGYVNKNKDYVVQEIQESRELFYLLGKSRTKTLTDKEKVIVNQQLIDILKTIPAFVIIALPFTFITLPTLLAILPKKAFPSSFQE